MIGVTDKYKGRAVKRRRMPQLEVNRGWFDTLRKALRPKTSQAKIAKKLGIEPSRLTETLQGIRVLKIGEAQKLSAIFERPLNEVLTAFGQGSDQKDKQKIHGYIGADDQLMLYADDYADENLNDEIDAPFPGYHGRVVRIRGDSMSPRYLDREVIAYTPESGDFQQLEGKEVVAKLPDGRLVLKILQKNGNGRYNLISINSRVPSIVNVEIDWVAKIDWHQP